MFKFFGLFILLGLFSAFCNSTKTDPLTEFASMEFGAKVKFSPNVRIKFKDFSIIYIGERRVSSEKFPNGFLYYDFKVQNQIENITISWTSGTGEIAPTAFQIGGNTYELELAMSDKLGKLAENELVIWKK
ncbi:MAG: hypothetical protein ABJA66_09605 [Actinomycetota bacterium]